MDCPDGWRLLNGPDAQKASGTSEKVPDDVAYLEDGGVQSQPLGQLFPPVVLQPTSPYAPPAIDS
jgi:hypothetical protein